MQLLFSIYEFYSKVGVKLEILTPNMMILNFAFLSYDCLNTWENWFIKTLITCFLLKPSSKVSTQKVSLKVYKKLLKVKFFCIFLPSNQKLALKYCIFIKIDSNFSNFITIWFDKFFETGKFEVKSHIVHCSKGYYYEPRQKSPISHLRSGLRVVKHKSKKVRQPKLHKNSP